MWLALLMGDVLRWIFMGRQKHADSSSVEDPQPRVGHVLILKLAAILKKNSESWESQSDFPCLLMWVIKEYSRQIQS
jgi:hypothetical protein